MWGGRRKKTPPLWLMRKFWFRRSTRKKRDFARQLRKNPTPPEKILWKHLRNKRLGVRFHRQSPILGWIADFWCPSCKLVVEIDGLAHELRKPQDEERDEILNRKAGIMTLRFPARVVMENPEHVVNEIKRFVDIRYFIYTSPWARKAARRTRA